MGFLVCMWGLLGLELILHVQVFCVLFEGVG